MLLLLLLIRDAVVSVAAGEGAGAAGVERALEPSFHMPLTFGLTPVMDNTPDSPETTTLLVHFELGR